MLQFEWMSSFLACNDHFLQFSNDHTASSLNEAGLLGSQEQQQFHVLSPGVFVRFGIRSVFFLATELKPLIFPFGWRNLPQAILPTFLFYSIRRLFHRKLFPFGCLYFFHYVDVSGSLTKVAPKCCNNYNISMNMVYIV